LSATPLVHPAPRADSRISAEGSAGRDVVVYLPKGLSKAGGSSGGGTPANFDVLQRQQSFEGTYRTLSTMHQLNLQKDMLHGNNRGARGIAGGRARESAGAGTR